MKQYLLVPVTALMALVTLTTLLFREADASAVTLSYQGKLTNSAGSPVPDSIYEITFGFFDDPVAGNELWMETNRSVATSNGLFNVVLGNLSPIDQAVFNTQPLWLQIEVGADPPFSPRTLLTSVPNAATALQLTGSVQTTPGTIAIMPPNPVNASDTLPHIKLSADSLFTTLNIHPPDPCDPFGGGNGGNMSMGVGAEANSFFDIMYSMDCQPDSGAGIKMSVDPSIAKLFLQHHQDSSSISLSVDQLPMLSIQDPATAALNLGIDPNEGGIIIINNKPAPGKAGGDTMRVKIRVDTAQAALSILSIGSGVGGGSHGAEISISSAPATGASLKLQPPPDDGYGSQVAISSAPATGATLKMFNSQPEPLGEPILTVNGGLANNSASIRMFNPQPEPPGHPILEMLSGIGAGAQISVFNPQVGAKGTDALYDTLVQISADSVTGGRVVIRNPVSGLSSVRTGEQLSFSSAAGGSSALINGNGNSYLINSNLGLGVYTPSNILTVVQNSATDPIADAWTTYSSRRWKKNIKTLHGSLEKVQRLRGVEYDWKKGGKHDIGLIAEEVGEVIPEIVCYEENGVDAKSVDYPRLVAVLIEATKEQQKTIDSQSSDIESLRNELAELRSVVKQLALQNNLEGATQYGLK